ncbi:hypothetical protein CTI14_00625 [Methylobacterium radiotolerans]|nr:hypothetical protein CTI14_00625 [Methylobacterium radiotolerans]
MRTGIEFHAASNARMLTAGCIGVAREQWGAFKDRMLSVYRRAGRAFLIVTADGATISANRPDDPAAKAAGEAQRTQDLGAKAKPNLPPNARGQSLGDLDVAGKAPARSLGSETPLSNRGTPGASIRGGGGRIGDTTTNITVNGYQKDGKELASEVQRSLQTDMNRRTHDYDGFA